MDFYRLHAGDSFMVITLIGYRGTGKTTVAAELASRLGWDFTDVDRDIENQTGKTVAEIFAESGEPYFREVERGVLLNGLARDRLVLSTGGGTIVNPDSRARVMAAGPVVWLQATPETIIERFNADPETTSRRPTLTGSDPYSEIPYMLAQRTPFYAEAATITILTDNRTIAGIVDDIMTQLPRSTEAGR